MNIWQSPVPPSLRALPSVRKTWSVMAPLKSKPVTGPLDIRTVALNKSPAALVMSHFHFQLRSSVSRVAPPGSPSQSCAFPHHDRRCCCVWKVQRVGGAHGHRAADRAAPRRVLRCDAMHPGSHSGDPAGVRGGRTGLWFPCRHSRPNPSRRPTRSSPPWQSIATALRPQKNFHQFRIIRYSPVEK